MSRDIVIALALCGIGFSLCAGVLFGLLANLSHKVVTDCDHNPMEGSDVQA